MAFYGSLVTFPLGDLIRWIADNGKSGLLRLDHDLVSTRIHWTDGRIVGCSSDDPPKLLGQFLMFRGVITEQQLRTAMSKQEATGRSLRDIFVDDGVIRRADLDFEIAAKAEETILGMFDLDKGTFGFREDDHVDPNAITVETDIEDLLLRSKQRCDDWARAGEIFDGTDTILRPTGKPPTARLQYDLPCLKVYEAIDGNSTIEEIVLRTHGTEYRVTACLLRLHDEGLIEPARAARPETRPHGKDADVATDPGDDAIRRMLGQPEPGLIDEIVAQGMAPDGVPVLRRPREEIAGEDITPAEGFLLDLSDGTWDVKSITWIAPMSPASALTALRDMEERGLIELSNPPSARTA